MRLPPFSVVVVLLFLSAAPYHTDARVHSNHTTRLRLLSSTPVNSTVASIKAAAYGVNRQSCSCANPQAVPLELDSTTRSSNDDEYFTGRKLSAHVAYGEKEDSLLCHALPLARPGGECGAQIAVCPRGYCCSQFGQCTRDPKGCDGTCQCRFSGEGSGCKGSFPFPLPRQLPVASKGGLCGAYVATCPSSQCCSMFGFCVNDTSIYCNMPSCILACSSLSPTCGAAQAAAAAISASNTQQDKQHAQVAAVSGSGTATQQPSQPSTSAPSSTVTAVDSAYDATYQTISDPTTTQQAAEDSSNDHSTGAREAEPLGYDRDHDHQNGPGPNGYRIHEGYRSPPADDMSTSPVDAVSLLDTFFNARPVKRFDWVVIWKNLTLDGYTKPVIVVNGKPFPTLEVDVNDRVIVKVTNKLNEPLSVHWHGMLQRRTNGMDGVVPVTQRPVDPGETFLYNFIADTAGTFWWHSHYSTQYVDGLWGALVIKDPTTAKVPVDAVVTITDNYHELANPLTQYYLSPESGGNEPVPNNALMNGRGQGYCGGSGQPECSYARIKGVAHNCSDPLTKLRIINAGAFAVFNVSIDNHRMIVVAEDGVAVDPVEIGSFEINDGQRYDVMVCQRGSGPYSEEPVWIRAVMIDANFATPSQYNTTLGVLYYREADANKLPTTTADYEAPAMTPSSAGLDVVHPYMLHAVGGITPPGPATLMLEYLIYFYNEPFNDPTGTQYAHFSKIALQMNPENPSLLERLSNNPQDLGPPRNVPVPPGGRGWHVVDIPLGSIVDIVINNNDTGEHPIHLHGHWFWVMDAGLPYSGDYNPNVTNPEGLFGRLARDTVTVNTKSYVVLRYLAVNPGVWIMHCHIDWHLAGGLGLLFKEGFPQAELPSGYEDDSDSTAGEPGYGPRSRRRYQYDDSGDDNSDESVGRRPYRRHEENEREPDSNDRNRYPEARNRVSRRQRREDAREQDQHYSRYHGERRRTSRGGPMRERPGADMDHRDL